MPDSRKNLRIIKGFHRRTALETVLFKRSSATRTATAGIAIRALGSLPPIVKQSYRFTLMRCAEMCIALGHLRTTMSHKCLEGIQVDAAHRGT